MTLKTFVVYEKPTTKLIYYFDTASSAKRSCTCRNKKNAGDFYGWTDYDTYCKTIHNNFSAGSVSSEYYWEQQQKLNENNK